MSNARGSIPSDGYGAGETVAEQVADLLPRLAKFVRSNIDATARSLGLTPMQARALRRLDKPMMMSDLAATLSVDPSYVTGIIDDLEELEFVERRPDPGDRRAKQLVLTAPGLQVREKLVEGIRHSTAPIFAVLAPDEQIQLRDAIRLVVDTAEQSDSTAG